MPLLYTLTQCHDTCAEAGLEMLIRGLHSFQCVYEPGHVLPRLHVEITRMSVRLHQDSYLQLPWEARKAATLTRRSIWAGPCRHSPTNSVQPWGLLGDTLRTRRKPGTAQAPASRCSTPFLGFLHTAQLSQAGRDAPACAGPETPVCGRVTEMPRTRVKAI